MRVRRICCVHLAHGGNLCCRLLHHRRASLCTPLVSAVACEAGKMQLCPHYANRLHQELHRHAPLLRCVFVCVCVFTRSVCVCDC